MRADRLRLALVSLLAVAAICGCSGTAQQRTGNGTSAQNAGQTTRSGISGATNNAGQTTRGGTMWSGTGNGTGNGPATDIGQQISSAVANLYSFSNRDGGAMLNAQSNAGTSVRVSTLVLGDLAYVGIDPTTVQENQRNGAQQSGLGGGATGNNGSTDTGTSTTAQVRTRVKAMFPNLAEVYVTTDPDLVYRIARVTSDQVELSPTEKVNEMAAIAREMTTEAATPGS